jgi:hypothetical protein
MLFWLARESREEELVCILGRPVNRLEPTLAGNCLSLLSSGEVESGISSGSAIETTGANQHVVV